MAPRFTSVVAILVALTCFLERFAWATSPESLGQAMERAGKLREALGHYVQALQQTGEGSMDEQRLRGKCITIAVELKPPPAIPEEARRHFVRGETALRAAKSLSDFEGAIKEYRKALLVAPWWGDAYYNLAVAQEKGGQVEGAIRSLKWYLTASPGAPDVRKVQDQLYALEYTLEQRKTTGRREEEQRQTRQREEETQAAKGRQLAGTWMNEDRFARYRVDVTGDRVEITLIAMCPRGDCRRWGWEPKNQRTFSGSYRDGALKGNHFDSSGKPFNIIIGGRDCQYPAGEHPATGTVSPDGRRMKIVTSFMSATPGCSPHPGILDLIRE